MAKRKPVADVRKVIIRDRIKELRRVPASSLKANPKNWREHPKAQRGALLAILQRIGFAAALVARELPGGDLELIDGHLRADVVPETIVPVLVLDVTEAEANQLLATIDPIGAMAEVNDVALASLLSSIEADNQDAIDSLATPTELIPVDMAPPPKMAWVLIGIPTVRYGEIAATIEAIGAMAEVKLETTVTTD